MYVITNLTCTLLYTCIFISWVVGQPDQHKNLGDQPSTFHHNKNNYDFIHNMFLVNTIICNIWKACREMLLTINYVKDLKKSPRFSYITSFFKFTFSTYQNKIFSYLRGVRYISSNQIHRLSSLNCLFIHSCTRFLTGILPSFAYSITITLLFFYSRNQVMCSCYLRKTW